MSVSTCFEVSTRRSGEAQIVNAAGEIDLATKDTLRTALFEPAPSGSNEIVLDLSQVTFMDSSGLALLCEAMRHLSSAGQSLRVVTAPGQVRKLIEISGLADVFDLDVPAAA